MSNKDWISTVRQLADSAAPMQAFSVFMQHKDEAVDLLFCEKACPSTEAYVSGSLFDANEASRANEDHLEDCRHVEASWSAWQDNDRFLPLFCETLTAALTQRGLPTPEYIR